MFATKDSVVELAPNVLFGFFFLLGYLSNTAEGIRQRSICFMTHYFCKLKYCVFLLRDVLLICRQ